MRTASILPGLRPLRRGTLVHGRTASSATRARPRDQPAAVYRTRTVFSHSFAKKFKRIFAAAGRPRNATSLLARGRGDHAKRVTRAARPLRWAALLANGHDGVFVEDEEALTAHSRVGPHALRVDGSITQLDGEWRACRCATGCHCPPQAPCPRAAPSARCPGARCLPRSAPPPPCVVGSALYQPAAAAVVRTSLPDMPEVRWGSLSAPRGS